MSEINEINIPNIVIPKFGTNDVWLNGVPFIPNNDPPVTTQIGFPIVEMPGCVKMHQDNKDHVTRLPFDHDLVNQDEKGSTTCLLYTSPSPRDKRQSRMPSSA